MTVGVVRSLPRASTRRAAVEGARTNYDAHRLEASAGEAGAREWLTRLPERVTLHVAAFDTRFRPPGWLARHPTRGIIRTLRRHDATVLAAPTSYFVDKHEQLVAGELERVYAWGEHLRRQLGTRLGDPTRTR